VIRGQRDPINLLFPAGDLDLARQIYTEVPMSKLNNSTVGELAAAVVAAAIAEKRATLRVVEIGAGTGGTTSQIAPRIAKVSVLLFTVTFYANHAHNLTRSP
jgi:protein-L-isoaspartate O-methyltransferase